MPSSATYAHLPLLSTSPLHGSFITTNEPMLTYHYHPESWFTLGFILGVVYFMGLDK